MTWYAPGDEVEVNEKADQRRTPVRPGTKGTVMSVFYENRRKRKQWLMVKLRGKSGNVIGCAKIPRNWLRRA